jgi:hypothetical protein
MAGGQMMQPGGAISTAIAGDRQRFAPPSAVRAADAGGKGGGAPQNPYMPQFGQNQQPWMGQQGGQNYGAGRFLYPPMMYPSQWQPQTYSAPTMPQYARPPAPGYGSGLFPFYGPTMGGGYGGGAPGGIDGPGGIGGAPGIGTVDGGMSESPGTAAIGADY